jgi:hypothetical protein
MKDVICFLDMDGCMHPFFPEPWLSDAENQFFSYVPNFEKAVLEGMKNYNISIVFSTSWRYSHTLEQMKAFFPDTINHLMVGVTPKAGVEFSTPVYNREDECKQYLKDNNLMDAHWFAIDDDPAIFYTPKKLLLCPNHFKDDEALKFHSMLLSC